MSPHDPARSCLRAALVAAFCVLSVPLVRAAPVREAAKPEKSQPLSLDDLYARLKAAGDDAEAKGVARLIEQRLGRSGSATADLLTERARQAMSGQDLPLAIELMDRATTLEPGWSEGWNRRATVFWMLSDPSAAIADLQRTLVLEPRHFEAWAALGRIYQSLDDKGRALEAFRRASALYPRMDRLQTAIDRLAPDVDGRDL
ncbi:MULTISPECIES: tetratricopeptide repeat protein [unclassified Methylobacterium]|uniref:tetratricopeptide repeat protein n=1 Tax=unclassified Methylobacterium TaxID=2615210 RepID=UPI000A785F7C|nr:MULTISPECIES: tetratricopeptide repeat protein [unclassified Methylobacterium]MCK2052771.1 tetratricopeptide repeat protein [Methylobacterium sp. 37f]